MKANSQEVDRKPNILFFISGSLTGEQLFLSMVPRPNLSILYIMAFILSSTLHFSCVVPLGLAVLLECIRRESGRKQNKKE